MFEISPPRAHSEFDEYVQTAPFAKRGMGPDTSTAAAAVSVGISDPPSVSHPKIYGSKLRDRLYEVLFGRMNAQSHPTIFPFSLPGAPLPGILTVWPTIEKSILTRIRGVMQAERSISACDTLFVM